VNVDEYLQERLQHQIDWYSLRSSRNQRMFKRLRAAEIITAALIPFASGLSAMAKSQVVGPVVIGLLGVCVAATAGLLALGRYHEKWIEYRTTAESLKKEKFSFLAEAAPYQNGASLQQLVRRVEALISKQNTDWTQLMNKPPDTAAGHPLE